MIAAKYIPLLSLFNVFCTALFFFPLGTILIIYHLCRCKHLLSAWYHVIYYFTLYDLYSLHFSQGVEEDYAEGASTIPENRTFSEECAVLEV